MIQSKLANMYVTLSACRSYVYNVARSLDQGHISPNVSSCLKIVVIFAHLNFFHIYILLNELQKDAIKYHFLFKNVGLSDMTSKELYDNQSAFLAHLSRRLIGELLVYRGIRRPSVRRQHFQTTSSLKPLGRFFSYFIYSIYR